jgi:hypothetical protein
VATARRQRRLRPAPAAGSCQHAAQGGTAASPQAAAKPRNLVAPVAFKALIGSRPDWTLHRGSVPLCDRVCGDMSPSVCRTFKTQGRGRTRARSTSPRTALPAACNLRCYRVDDFMKVWLWQKCSQIDRQCLCEAHVQSLTEASGRHFHFCCWDIQQAHERVGHTSSANPKHARSLPHIPSSV